MTKVFQDTPATHRPETFLSRDGGLSWEVVLSNDCDHVNEKTTMCLHRFAFGDHGSILAAAPAQGEVDAMQYTLDEGITWHEASLPRFSVLAEVTQQLEAASTSFMVVGEAPQSAENHNSRANEGLVVFVDFAGLKQRRCEGEQWAGHGGSDFEKWSPRSNTGIENLPRCFNGHETLYVRRMRLNDCTVHIARQLLVHQHHCDCTVDDYECRGTAGDVCVAPSEALSLTVQDLCHRPGKRPSTQVQGYRLIDSDTCKKGISMPSTSTECGVLKPNKPLPGVRDLGPHVEAKKQGPTTAIGGSHVSATLLVVIGVLLLCVLGGGMTIFVYVRGVNDVKVAQYSYGRVGDNTAMPDSALDDVDEMNDGEEEGMTYVIDDIRDTGEE